MKSVGLTICLLASSMHADINLVVGDSDVFPKPVGVTPHRLVALQDFCPRLSSLPLELLAKGPSNDREDEDSIRSLHDTVGRLNATLGDIALPRDEVCLILEDILSGEVSGGVTPTCDEHHENRQALLFFRFPSDLV